MAEPCYACDGDGYDPFVYGKSVGNCKRCKGGGTERVMTETPCRECGGSGGGHLIGEYPRPCAKCGGHGRETEPTSLRRYKTGGYGAMVEDENGRWYGRADVDAAIQRVIDWCDERRNAQDITTLGAVQHKLRWILREKGGA